MFLLRHLNVRLLNIRLSLSRLLQGSEPAALTSRTFLFLPAFSLTTKIPNKVPCLAEDTSSGGEREQTHSLPGVDRTFSTDPSGSDRLLDVHSKMHNYDPSNF